MAVHARRGRRADPAIRSLRLAPSRTGHPTALAGLLVCARVSRCGCCSPCDHRGALGAATPLGQGVCSGARRPPCETPGHGSHSQHPMCGGPTREAESGACRGGPRLDNAGGRWRGSGLRGWGTPPIPARCFRLWSNVIALLGGRLSGASCSSIIVIRKARRGRRRSAPKGGPSLSYARGQHGRGQGGLEVLHGDRIRAFRVAWPAYGPRAGPLDSGGAATGAPL